MNCPLCGEDGQQLFSSFECKTPGCKNCVYPATFSFKQIAEIAKWLYWEDRDRWRIMEDNLSIYGDTYMDNFDMDFFLTKIGVSREDVEWYE